MDEDVGRLPEHPRHGPGPAVTGVRPHHQIRQILVLAWTERRATALDPLDLSVKPRFFAGITLAGPTAGTRFRHARVAAHDGRRVVRRERGGALVARHGRWWAMRVGGRTAAVPAGAPHVVPQPHDLPGLGVGSGLAWPVW
jgi:hypothetical protein